MPNPNEIHIDPAIDDQSDIWGPGYGEVEPDEGSEHVAVEADRRQKRAEAKQKEAKPEPEAAKPEPEKEEAAPAEEPAPAEEETPAEPVAPTDDDFDEARQAYEAFVAAAPEQKEVVTPPPAAPAPQDERIDKLTSALETAVKALADRSMPDDTPDPAAIWNDPDVTASLQAAMDSDEPMAGILPILHEVTKKTTSDAVAAAVKPIQDRIEEQNTTQASIQAAQRIRSHINTALAAAASKSHYHKMVAEDLLARGTDSPLGQRLAPIMNASPEAVMAPGLIASTIDSLVLDIRTGDGKTLSTPPGTTATTAAAGRDLTPSARRAQDTKPPAEQTEEEQSKELWGEPSKLSTFAMYQPSGS